MVLLMENLLMHSRPQPESKILEMINKMIDAAPGNELPKLLEEASAYFQSQKFRGIINI